MYRRNTLIIAFVLLIGCSGKEKDLNSLCKDIRNSYECAQVIEKHQLAIYGDLVKRVDGQLILKIDNNVDLVIEDIKSDWDDCKLHSFRDYFEDINSYIVEIQYWEGGAYYLINKSLGTKIVIPGLIAVSPDKKRFVSYNIDIEAAYSPNGFEIYRLGDNSFSKEFEFFLDDWGPSNALWINNNQIEFEKSAWKDSEVQVLGKVIYEFDQS